MEKNAKYSPAVIAGKAAVMVFLSQVLLSHQNSLFFFFFFFVVFQAFISFCTIQPYLVPLTSLPVHITQYDSAWGKILINDV